MHDKIKINKISIGYNQLYNMINHRAGYVFENLKTTKYYKILSYFKKIYKIIKFKVNV